MANSSNNSGKWTSLGNICVNPRGGYSNLDTYNFLDMVSFEGGSYICLLNNTQGVTPEKNSNTDTWFCSSTAGEADPDFVNMVAETKLAAETVSNNAVSAKESAEKAQKSEANTAGAAEEIENAKNTVAEYAKSAEKSSEKAMEAEENTIEALGTLSLEYKNSILKLLYGDIELAQATISGAGTGGIDAREVELRKSSTAIQWRYTGDETWNDLVALVEITGAQGEQGIPGPKGEPGVTGAQGEQGPAGEPGKDGRGITSVTIKTDGHLQIDYSDGTEVDVGKVTGNDGLDGTSGVPVRIEKTSSDTTAELDPNKLYVFPEMASLTYTLAAPADTSIANEYHFVFRSGATATELVHPANVSVPDGFAVEKNKVYEISILEGCMAYQSWAVS